MDAELAPAEVDRRWTASAVAGRISTFVFLALAALDLGWNVDDRLDGRAGYAYETAGMLLLLVVTYDPFFNDVSRRVRLGLRTLLLAIVVLGVVMVVVNPD